MIKTSFHTDEGQLAANNSRISCILIIKSNAMSIVKVIEVLAESPKSWEDAAQQAVHEASKTVHNIRSLYIKEHSVVLDKNNKIEAYRINAKLSFEVETQEKNLSAKG
jgi:flavin-binding protein dodecin